MRLSGIKGLWGLLGSVKGLWGLLGSEGVG